MGSSSIQPSALDCASAECLELRAYLAETCQEVDEVAFVRFVSVYRDFSDIHDFVHELQPMLNQAKSDTKGADEVRNAK